MCSAKRKMSDGYPSGSGAADGPSPWPPTNAAKRARRTPSGPAAGPEHVTRFWFAGRRAPRIRRALAEVRSRWYGGLRGVLVTPDVGRNGCVVNVRTRDAGGAVPVAWALWRELHADRPRDDDRDGRERRGRRGPEWTIRVLVDAAAARDVDGGDDGSDDDAGAVQVEPFGRAAGRGQSVVVIRGAARDAVRRLSRVLAAAARDASDRCPSPPRAGRSISAAADYGEWPVCAMPAAARPSPPRSPVPSTSWQDVRAARPSPVTSCSSAPVITAADYGEWPSDDDDD